MAVLVEVIEGDVLREAGDLLVLKYADGFHGLDAVVSRELGYAGPVLKGEHVIIESPQLEVDRVLFIGVGPLFGFRYNEIREFAVRLCQLVANLEPQPSRVLLTIHGPGYGLDEGEAFLSLLSGLEEGIELCPGLPPAFAVVEKNAARALLCRRLAQERERSRSRAISASLPLAIDASWSSRGALRDNEKYGRESERKTKLFIAMPFDSAFDDEWLIAFREGAHEAHYICERMDNVHFTGDVVNEIRTRIMGSDGVIGLLNGANPNVFLEIGFAWACNKPTILVAREGEELPFDVQGQKCIYYRSISELRARISSELQLLHGSGAFSAPVN